MYKEIIEHHRNLYKDKDRESLIILISIAQLYIIENNLSPEEYIEFSDKIYKELKEV
jgi:hypothetical protein